MSFANKTIVLTGASAGIGRSLSISLAQQGASLVLAARNQEALAETLARCTKQGGKAISVPCASVQAPATSSKILSNTEMKPRCHESHKESAVALGCGRSPHQSSLEC